MNDILQPVTYRGDVIFCNEIKIMLQYNDGPPKVWQKQLTALENNNGVHNNVCKFGFMQENKPRFKFYHDNDPKHRTNMVRMWLPGHRGVVGGVLAY